MRRSRSCRGLGARAQALWAGESLLTSGRNLRGRVKGRLGRTAGQGTLGLRAPVSRLGHIRWMGSWGRGLGRRGIWCTFYKSVPWSGGWGAAGD